jgi:short-subunit dehydrogenase
MNNPSRPVALVTGASSGIGAALARELAADAHDLILVARSEAAMQALAAELTAQHGIHCHVFAADLTRPEAPAELQRRIAERGLAVDVLINNAGVGFCDYFHRQDPQRIEAMLALSVTALTALTRLFLPAMVARQRGAVLNVASTAAYLPEPTMAVYAASKAYVLSFTVALSEELRGSGVSATALCPGPTKSNFARAAELEHNPVFSAALTMDAAAGARSACAALKRGRRVAIPGFANRLSAVLAGLMPYRLLLPATQKMLAARR